MLAVALFVALAAASSHSEAPGTARGPHTDLTDLYMFMTARDNVALVANVAGLSQSQAGPNYNPLNNDFIYQIHIDNNGDGFEDITFQFLTGYRYANNGIGLTVNVQGVQVPIPLAHVAGRTFGPIHFNATSNTTSNLNSEEYYRVRVLAGDAYTSSIESGPFLYVVRNGTKSFEFTKAFDYAGTKSFGEKLAAQNAGKSPAYEAYVRGAAIYHDVVFPGCNETGSIFVGPRRESFGIALGEVFDAVNIDPGPAFDLGVRASEANSGAEQYDGNSLDRMSVISFVIEVPPKCLQNSLRGDVLGAWASVRSLQHQTGRAGVAKHFAGEQVSRLGNPLVNELLIGTTFKNEWSARHPSGDARFNQFLLTPVLPVYIESLFGIDGVKAPNFTRDDLVAVFHTGIPGFNRPLNQANSTHNDRKGGIRQRTRHHPTPSPSPPMLVYADLLRMNLTRATWVPCAQQSPLGALAGDDAGYPNGRRLGDDVVDITLRVAMGALCSDAQSAAHFCGSADNVAPPPSSTLKYTDQAPVRACMFRCDPINDFPFLNTPIPGNKLFQPNSPYTVSQFNAGCAPGEFRD